MTDLKKYDISGKEIGEVPIDDGLLKEKANKQMIKDYVVAVRANARQWSANTKERSDVRCSTQKPHPQKGTGRARQGYLAAPQFRGGGIVFGPKPKFDQHVRINKKERRLVTQFILSQKIVSGNIHIVDLSSFEGPKTKNVASFLKALKLQGKLVLFAGQPLSQKEEAEQRPGALKSCEFVRSMRNIPRTAFMPIGNLSGYDLLRFTDIILADSVVDDLIAVLKR